MNKKKSCLVLSTPYPERTRYVCNLFEDIECSPITEPLQLKNPVDPQPIAQSSKQNEAEQARAIKKRRDAGKEKAAPESATAGVLKELGVISEDVCNNVLSHSRNLYNMYPEPIILDSDNEENSIIVKNPVKKRRQDSKVTQCNTEKNPEEKKIKEPVPGSSRTTRLMRPAEDRTKNKKTSAQTSSSVSQNLKNKESKAKHQTKIKPPIRLESTVVIDDDNDESLFPVYQPGTSIHQTMNKPKIKEKLRLSLEMDEMFPIEWSQRRQKTGNKNSEEVPDVENIEVRDSNKMEKNNNENKTSTHTQVTKVSTGTKVGVKNTVEVCGRNEVEKNDNEKEITKNFRVTRNGRRNKATVSNEVNQKISHKKNVKSKDGNVVESENECPALISRFENVVFKASNTCGGIVAKCLKTDQNDIGYLEVSEDGVFNGQSTNITFVVIEGNAKIFHLGKEQVLSTGDMIHIKDGCGYKFESAGTSHVRFLYIKPH